MVLHRYFRYAPVLMILILFFVSPMKFMVFGPFSYYDTLASHCEEYWWTSILHISNYVNPNEMVREISKIETLIVHPTNFAPTVPRP